MSFHTGPNTTKKKKLDMSDQLSKPILTLLLVCVSSVAVMSDGHIDWVSKNGITPLMLNTFLTKGDYMGMFSAAFRTSLAQFSPYIWIFNSFFLWTFGSLTEQRLGGLRYMVFLMAAVFGSFILVYYQATDPTKVYIGPSMLLFCLLGSYLMFKPKKPFKPADWFRPAWKIFRENEPPALFERYWVSPWLFISSFIVYQGALQFLLTVNKDWLIDHTHTQMAGAVYLALFHRMQEVPAAFAPIPALESVGVGAALATLLLTIQASIKVKRPGGKLQVQCLQHYRELRALDMTHDQACEGAAKFTAVPIDIARDWIAKGTAALKGQTDLNQADLK
jgi:membrane associated rhomboid family serine protease